MTRFRSAWDRYMARQMTEGNPKAMAEVAEYQRAGDEARAKRSSAAEKGWRTRRRPCTQAGAKAHDAAR